MYIKILILTFFIIGLCFTKENSYDYPKCSSENDWLEYLRINCRNNNILNIDKKNNIKKFCKNINCYKEYKSNKNILSIHFKKGCDNKNNYNIFSKHINEGCYILKKQEKK